MNHTSTLPLPEGATKKADFAPKLLQSEHHHLCAGCGHPMAVRVILEAIEELQLEGRVIALFGHGCSGSFMQTADIDLTIALHGRAPATATGVKRMRPDKVVFTMQGDGDMVTEGLAEILYAASRGENITCFLLNNGVFGDTGGQMTAATVIGQRTKTTMEGRDPQHHGHPLAIADILSTMPGVSYVARATVGNPAGIAMARKFVRKAFNHQIEGRGLSFVEILTMCPTGWFKATKDGPDYMSETLGATYGLGQFKDDLRPTAA